MTDIQDEVQVIYTSHKVVTIIHLLSIIQDSRTGLMLATSRGHTEIVRLLAEAKADPNITDRVKLRYTHYCI